MDTKKSLKFTKYEGHKDPQLHMQFLESEVSIITLDRYLHAKLFPLTLKGNALLWFNKFPKNNIQDFSQLKRSFISAFKVFIPLKTSFTKLMKLKQREGQTIEDFIKHWKKIANKVTIDDKHKIDIFI